MDTGSRFEDGIVTEEEQAQKIEQIKEIECLDEEFEKMMRGVAS